MSTVIQFKDVKLGERFRPRFSKRRCTGVKVGDTPMLNPVTGGVAMCNTVILLDHTGQPAHDLGSLCVSTPELEVEVDRDQPPSQ